MLQIDVLRIADLFREAIDMTPCIVEITDAHINDDGEGELQWHISDGDWKHDHLYTEQILKGILDREGISYNIYESDPDEPSDSDTYSASHNAVLKKPDEEFDIVLKISDTEYGIGMVYPDEDNGKGFKLWAAHEHYYKDTDGTIGEFINTVNKAYEWDNLPNEQAALDEFIDYWCGEPTRVTVKRITDIKQLGNLEFGICQLKTLGNKGGIEL